MLLGIQSETDHGRNLSPSNNFLNRNISFHGDQGYNLSYSQGQSVAGQTLQSYGLDKNSATQCQPPNKIDTREHLVTSLQHTFGRENNFSSPFPLGFKGCYHCGDTAHFSTSECSAVQNGNFNKKGFFRSCGFTNHTRERKNTIKIVLQQAILIVQTILAHRF